VFYNRTLLYGLPGVRAALLEQHEAIAAAIAAHDCDHARKAARSHISYVELKLAEAEKVSARDSVSRLRLARTSRSLKAESKHA
jgi:GntR family transcriptional repressor for pyruvate dehydrogenase complex